MSKVDEMFAKTFGAVASSGGLPAPGSTIKINVTGYDYREDVVTDHRARDCGGFFKEFSELPEDTQREIESWEPIQNRWGNDDPIRQDILTIKTSALNYNFEADVSVFLPKCWLSLENASPRNKIVKWAQDIGFPVTDGEPFNLGEFLTFAKTLTYEAEVSENKNGYPTIYFNHISVADGVTKASGDLTAGQLEFLAEVKENLEGKTLAEVKEYNPGGAWGDSWNELRQSGYIVIDENGLVSVTDLE